MQRERIPAVSVVAEPALVVGLLVGEHLVFVLLLGRKSHVPDIPVAFASFLIVSAAARAVQVAAAEVYRLVRHALALICTEP